MWDALKGPVDLFCVTTNAMTRPRDNALVMGRGIAKEAALKHPELPLKAGARILELGVRSKRYGLLLIPVGGVPFGIFQVKYHWQDEADLGLIEYSVERLQKAITLYGFQNVHLNMPGTGNGRLPRELVLPLVERLGDEVTVWEWR